MMKILIISIVLFLSAGVSISQITNADLNGKIFIGTATEVTAPDSERMPVVYNEIVRFDNGMIYSDLLNMYSADGCSYSSKVDERRMIAFTVINFYAESAGAIDGKKVNLIFSGEVTGNINLSGLLTIKYPDNTEVSFNVSAVSK